jgi:hypothetical protein
MSGKADRHDAYFFLSGPSFTIVEFGSLFLSHTGRPKLLRSSQSRVPSTVLLEVLRKFLYISVLTLTSMIQKKLTHPCSNIVLVIFKSPLFIAQITIILTNGMKAITFESGWSYKNFNIFGHGATERSWIQLVLKSVWYATSTLRYYYTTLNSFQIQWLVLHNGTTTTMA